MDWSICSIFLAALAFEILYVGFKAGILSEHGQHRKGKRTRERK